MVFILHKGNLLFAYEWFFEVSLQTTRDLVSSLHMPVPGGPEGSGIRQAPMTDHLGLGPRHCQVQEQTEGLLEAAPVPAHSPAGQAGQA